MHIRHGTALAGGQIVSRSALARCSVAPVALYQRSDQPALGEGEPQRTAAVALVLTVQACGGSGRYKLSWPALSKDVETRQCGWCC